MDHPLPSTIIMLQISCLSASQPGRSRISQTVGCQPLYFGQKPIIWQDFCRKLRENERNWSKRGRGSLDRPMTNTYHWRIQGGGAPGTRPHPRGTKFFHFHAVFGKNLKNNSNFESWRIPWGKSWIRHCI